MSDTEMNSLRSLEGVEVGELPVTDDDAVSEAASGSGADPLHYPCSIAQERFWLLDRIEPGNSSLNVAVRWRLLGKVDAPLLEKAWLHIINRHEVLRTVFREVDGKPVQVIQPSSMFMLVEIDLTSLPEAERSAEGDRIGVIEARAPFDLTAGPMVRATLLRYGVDDAVLLVTTHQIVSDGWSIGVMAREMGTLYQALAAGTAIPLDDLPLQYADYAEWHLAWTQERGTAAEEAYWSRQLSGLKPFKVPADKPRPATPTTNGAITSIVLARELTQRAQTVSGQFGATLFAAAFASLTTMLHRYTGETEIVIGTQVSDRDQVELEGMIGQFVNSLILRNDLSGNPSFGELIERMRDTSAAALEHKHIPIERLLSMVKGGRRSAQTALISVNFIFQRTFIQNEDYGAFKLVDMPSLPAGAIYDLNFFMVERPDGWRLSCQYNTDQFERETVDRLLAYVRTILDVACRDPRVRLSAIPMIPAEERERLTTSAPADVAVIGLLARFAEQVANRPNAVAVVAGERTLSYRQLDAEAGRLAGYLISRGVKAGTRVGLCLERGADWPVSLLAVLRIGAVWVALDPQEPASRIGLMLDSARVAAVITRAPQITPLPVDRQTVINLDAEASAISRAPIPDAEHPLGADEACVYAVATPSGRPAVYRLSHGALEAQLLALAKRPGLAATDTMLAVSPPTLDASLVEVLLPLLVGARLVIATDAELRDDRRLVQWLQKPEHAVLHASPLVLSRLIAGGWDGSPKLTVWSFGERPDPRLAQLLLDRSRTTWTLYSAPGAAICVACHALTRAEDVRVIGSPLPGTQLRVQDAARQLLPTGAVGELHVAGIALPVGSFTVASPNDRLIIAPDAGTIDNRLLRTGDRARMRNDGLYELLTRRDRAVQLGGQWLEPAEIEGLLCRHPNVAEAAVRIGQQAGDGVVTTTITAWIVLTGGGGNQEIGEILRKSYVGRLPAALMPTQFNLVDSLPRTATGDVDFQTLRRPVPTAAPSGANSTHVELKLRRLWSTMLGRDDVDLDSNFFELGGHSLLAARMLGRVESEFGRRIGLAALFRAPTVRELARLLESEDSRDFDFRQVVKLQPNGSRPPMIAINNTGSYYLLAKRLGPDQPVTSLQLFDPTVSIESLPKTLEAIASGYVQLIRRVQPKGPYLLMGWCVAGALAFEVARQLQAEGQRVANLYLMDSWVPNYLRRLPTLRRLINDYTLRLQFVFDDFRRLRAKGAGLGVFLANRSSFRLLLQLFGRGAGTTSPPAAVQNVDEPEGYDQWLLAYLQDVTSRYEPKRFDGPITLFRSHDEPTGLWFDPGAGWGPFAGKGLDLHMVDGDHFTMFQEPGVSQMAKQISAQIVGPNPTSTASIEESR